MKNRQADGRNLFPRLCESFARTDACGGVGDDSFYGLLAQQGAERRMARLVELGIRQVRYLGTAKVEVQVALAVTVAKPCSGLTGPHAGSVHRLMAAPEPCRLTLRRMVLLCCDVM